MKKVLLLALLLTVGLSFGQDKESISFSSKTVEVNQNIWALIKNYNPKTTYILDIETANDLMVLDNTIIDSLGRFKFYIEKNGKHLGAFKKVNNNTGEKEFLQTVILDITPEKIGFVINNIEVQKFSQMKEEHHAWDNGMGNYLPDVYINLSINDKTIYHSQVSYDRKYNEPYNCKLQKLWKIGVSKEFNKTDMIKVILWDDDSITDDDFMGGLQFTREAIHQYFPKNKKVKVFEVKKQDLKLVINYEWMSEEELKNTL